MISNLGKGALGTSGAEDEIHLDLAAELPDNLRAKFDVVFNHTTLEHIYEVHTAIANLCALTRDIVILVVPFSQKVHFDWAEGTFLDYWRFTPFALQALFREHGLEMVYWSSNENPVYPQYLFVIASRQPEKWKPKFPSLKPITKETAPGYCWSAGKPPCSMT